MTLDDFADTLRSMGYAVELDDCAVTLPGHWRVRRFAPWWVLEYRLTRGRRDWWERYGLYAGLQEAIEKGMEL